MKRPPIIPILLILFTTFTLLEIWLIFILASLTNWPATILIAIVTGLIGSVMIKKQGLTVWRQGSNEMRSGKFPAQSIAEGVMIIIGGAFLMTPGVITDLIGLSTLVPPIRKLYGKLLIVFIKKNFKVKPITPGSGAGQPGSFQFHFGNNRSPFGNPQGGRSQPDDHNPFDDKFPGHDRKPITNNDDDDVVDVEFTRKD